MERTLESTFSAQVKTNFGIKANKRRAIANLVRKGFEITLAFGDSEADAPLLEAAEYPFVIANGRNVSALNTYLKVRPESVLAAVKATVLK